MHYKEFFITATGHPPYDYQCRLACGPSARAEDPDTLRESTPCESRLIDIPTGLGKTAAVVLAWLWNRLRSQDVTSNRWPRRLVYCLPMRTLVEQTRINVQSWLENVDLTDRVRVKILMGGEEKTYWDLYPERETILIGTQDILLSRALNRGFGMSRYRWPMHFGLLNNDALWVMDETQLMGVGVETSAQLDGLRNSIGGFANTPTWWMSATLENDRLETVDHPAPADGWLVERLTEEESKAGRPGQLCSAAKPISRAELTLSAVSKKSYPKELAAYVASEHREGSLTLVIVNRVDRAREVYQALAGAKKPLYDPSRVSLIHSRFRPADRAEHEVLLLGEGDRVVVATQAVEAGVDVSSRLLITELAPWASLVQRFGRCNRCGDMDDAQIVWLDVQPKDEKDSLLLPYSLTELARAREALVKLDDAGPGRLRSVEVTEEKTVRPVIRRVDLLDLFDTTPDLCGQDIDISRYVRDGDDTDVQFFWRDVEDTPTADEPSPNRNELCRVPVGEAQRFFKATGTKAWRWNALESCWDKAERAIPGAVFLISCASGGYDAKLGWTGKPKDNPEPLILPTEKPESYSANESSCNASWQTIADHTERVVKEGEVICESVAIPEPFGNVLQLAARWHDCGKSHQVFQSMLVQGDQTRAARLWAKSAARGGCCERRGFRHELASALAWLQNGPSETEEFDLIAYLIAAHHGKVRLSIRSLPGEDGNLDAPDELFARGVWQGDQLPETDLGGLTVPATELDLSCMRMGQGPTGPSWLARTIALRNREDLGPFRLAYLETILRAADARASQA